MPTGHAIYMQAHDLELALGEATASAGYHVINLDNITDGVDMSDDMVTTKSVVVIKGSKCLLSLSTALVQVELVRFERHLFA